MSNYKPPMSMKEAMKLALDVQNAVNLVAILKSWHEASRAVMKAHGNSSTAFFLHPVNILFMSKVASLMGVYTDCIGGIQHDGRDLFRQAYATAREETET